MGMQAGHVRIKRYKARRRRRAALLLLIIGLAGGVWWMHGKTPEKIPWISAPAPTLTPEETAWEEMDYTIPGQRWYALQLGVFEQKEAAQQLAQKYRRRGAGGYVMQDEGGYRVLAAAYASRADAVQVQQNLLNYHQVESFVTEIASPDVQVHLQGQRAQLDALMQAYAFLHQAAGDSAHWSLQWDAGSMEKEMLLSALGSQQQTAQSLRDRLVQCFGQENAHPAARFLQESLETLSALWQSARTEQASTTELGAQVKAGQLHCICAMTSHACALSAQLSSP